MGKTIWSFDFGLMTGFAVGYYGEATPYTLARAGQIPGGMAGFKEWLFDNEMSTSSTVVAEKFALNPGEGNLFIPDIVGVPLEGALEMFYDGEIHWQTRSAKAGVPDWILKENGLWQTDSQLEDARDANDAIVHALEYLRRSAHVPTLKKYFRNIS